MEAEALARSGVTSVTLGSKATAPADVLEGSTGGSTRRTGRVSILPCSAAVACADLDVSAPYYRAGTAARGPRAFIVVLGHRSSPVAASADLLWRSIGALKCWQSRRFSSHL